MWELTLRTATKIGGFMLAYAPAACLGSTLILLGVTSKLSNLLLGISHNIYIILFHCGDHSDDRQDVPGHDF